MSELLQPFLDRLVHDLREPLRSIHAFTEVLKESSFDPANPERKEAFTEILSAASRMQVLVDGVSKYSLALHRPPDVTTPVSLQLAFRIVLGTMATRIQETGAQIVAEPLPLVCANLDGAIQLFENLIGNALKFRREEPAKIRVSARRGEDGWWVIGFEDNGIGVPPEYAEAIFSPFVRLHGRKYAGAGLGLTVCRRIVESHGGRIWLESTPPPGTMFYFTFPPAEELNS